MWWLLWVAHSPSLNSGTLDSNWDKLGLGIRTQVYMYILKIICLVGFDLMMQTRVKMMTRLRVDIFKTGE